MRLSDTAAGLLILCVGVTVAVYARGFPAIPGQQVGPSVFPVAIGTALALLGAALVVTGLRQPGVGMIRLDDWARQPLRALRFLLVIGVLLFYALTVDRVGFFLTAFAFLIVLLLAFGVRRTWIAPLAAAVTLAIHYAFYGLLHVPLPWGVLDAFAW